MAAAMLTAVEQEGLVQRIREGDGQAESELVSRFLPRVFEFSLARTCSYESARDLGQDAMLAVLRALRGGKLRDDQKLVPFILGTTRNLIQNHFRRVSRRPQEEPIAEDLPAPGWEDPALAAHRTSALREAIQALDQDSRRVLLWALVDGLTPAEISHRLGLPSEVIRQRKSRALKRVREFFRRRPLL
jgi:RNA polymerase sigma factor (sigma-70 family)